MLTYLISQPLLPLQFHAELLNLTNWLYWSSFFQITINFEFATKIHFLRKRKFIFWEKEAKNNSNSVINNSFINSVINYEKMSIDNYEKNPEDILEKN